MKETPGRLVHVVQRVAGLVVGPDHE